MTSDFVKFPPTPHLAVLPGTNIREDKVLTTSGRDAFLRHDIAIEEKVDGANLGISFDSAGHIRAQNRGAYLRLPESGQWRALNAWLAQHTDRLFDHLSDRYILFGEWCYARHAIFYDRLPDWFLAFDVYDRSSQRFLSWARCGQMVAAMRIARVPQLAHGQFSCAELHTFLSQSHLADRKAEGIYLRRDQGDWLEQRAKLVCSQFIQELDEHWSRAPIKPNQLNGEVQKFAQ